MTEVIDVEPSIESTDIVQYTPQIRSTPEQIKADLERNYQVLHEFMREGVDYLEIRGKKSLTQAGAERLCRFFNLGEQTHLMEQTEHWPSEDDGGFLTYHYKTLVGPLTPVGIIPVASGEGTANSQELKYKNQNIHDVAHTVRSIARKRAFTAGVRRATGTSEFWSDSLEDLPPEMLSNKKPGPVKTPMMDNDEPQSPQDVMLPWGKKHAGETLGDILRADPTYIQWLAKALAAKEERGELPDDQVGLKYAVDLIVESA